MNPRRTLNSSLRHCIWLAAFIPLTARTSAAEPPSPALAAFDAYVRTVELRLDHQHASADHFIASPPQSVPSAERTVSIERLTPPPVAGSSTGLIEHWRATAFVPGGKASDLDRILRDVPSYPLRFAPQVLNASASAQPAAGLITHLRFRQQHVITVVLDGTFAVHFGQLDPSHRFSTSRSIAIREIADAGTRQERTLPPSEEHGWLWRMNTYWTWEERDGGLHLQVESVTLSRSVPHGLGWVLGPYVESIPRESLDFTLQAACRALTR